MAAQRKWSLDEITMAFALYFTLSPKEYNGCEAIDEFAKLIGRTSGSVKLKLWNIAAHDQTRIALGLKGLPNGGKLDKEIWSIYAKRGDDLITEGLVMIENLKKGFLDENLRLEIVPLEPGLEKKVETTQRVNQNYFRNTLMTSYSQKCCVTGLAIPTLLVASHIKPWSASKNSREERLDPSNGLLLNALHDKAFDKGFITLNDHYEIVLGSTLKRNRDADEACSFISQFEGQMITLPLGKPPSLDYIHYHNDVVFQR